MATVSTKGMTESVLWPRLRDYWLPVAFSEEVGDKPLPVRLLDERLAICRLGDEVAAFYDLCIHRGTPISLGRIENGEVVCAYHGWSYNAEGRCTRIPSVPPAHPIPKKACLTRYRAQERYGLVWVFMGEGEPRAPIPAFPPLEDPSFHVIFRDKRHWDCSAARAIENFFDFGHFAWVHDGILGTRDQPIPPEVTLERDGEYIRFQAHERPNSTHTIPHERRYIVSRPFSIYQRKEELDGKTEALIFVCQPVSAGECFRFMFVARNYEGGPYAGKEKNFALQDLLAEQDRLIVENQRPEELPLDLAEELHIKGPDALALAYRRFLGDLGVE